MNKRSFVYRERTVDDIKERANQRSGGFDDFIKPSYKKYKTRDGKNLIRILPPTWEGARHYGYDIWLNYSIGPDNQAYLSLSKMKGEKDPIAEAQRVAAREGDEKLSRELTPRKRILMWIIDRNDEDEGPQLWAAPITVDKAFATLSHDEDTGEIVFIDDPENGHDVRFYKEGSGLKTDYDAAKIKLLQKSPISQDEKLQNRWLDYVQENPVPSCLQFYDYKHISNTFDGGAGSEGVDSVEVEGKGQEKRYVGASNGRDPIPDENPIPRRRTAVVQPDEEDEPIAPRRVSTKEVDDPPAGGSIRDRIRARQAAARASVDEED